MMDRTVVIQNLDISWKYAFMATSPACVISYSYSRNLERMEQKAYEDGFTVGEDWSNTNNTVTTMMALRRLYGFSTKRLLDVIRTANGYVEMANRGEMSVLSMIQDIEENTDVRFDEINKNLVKKMGV